MDKTIIDEPFNETRMYTGTIENDYYGAIIDPVECVIIEQASNRVCLTRNTIDALAGTEKSYADVRLFMRQVQEDI